MMATTVIDQKKRIELFSVPLQLMERARGTTDPRKSAHLFESVGVEAELALKNKMREIGGDRNSARLFREGAWLAIVGYTEAASLNYSTDRELAAKNVNDALRMCGTNSFTAETLDETTLMNRLFAVAKRVNQDAAVEAMYGIKRE